MSDKETPYPQRVPRTPSSGTHWRLEGLDKQLEQIDRTMASILGKLDTLSEVTAQLRALQTSVDDMRDRLADERRNVERNDHRIDALEQWRAATEQVLSEQKKAIEHAGHATAGKLLAGSATGGGLIYGIVEGLRAWLGV